VKLLGDDWHSCERCGVKCEAQFCRDCRDVDPVMTAGGLSARQRKDRRSLLSCRDELHHQEILASLSVKQEQRQNAARQVQKLRARIAKLEERLAA
jgi:hypothetical protein